MAASPVVTGMRVIPVAGRDSMLLNLAGAHAPFFIRNLVLLEDDSGHTGIGEVPGSEGIRRALERSIPLVVGSEIGRYHRTLDAIRRLDHRGTRSPRPPRPRSSSSRTRSTCAWTTCSPRSRRRCSTSWVSTGVPVCELLGSGRRARLGRMLAYLFYIGDRGRTDLPYLALLGHGIAWYRVRHKAALTPEAIVAQAEAAVDRYGFRDFKLKGGVMAGEEEMRAVARSSAAFPRAA
jgi:glucarate dehydratase